MWAAWGWRLSRSWGAALQGRAWGPVLKADHKTQRSRQKPGAQRSRQILRPSAPGRAREPQLQAEPRPHLSILQSLQGGSHTASRQETGDEADMKVTF